MTEEQIKQNAEEYADKNCIFDYNSTENDAVINAYIAGAHSQDEEMAELKKLLNNAVEILKDTYGEDDYFCTKLLDIDEEAKVCESHCENLEKKCIIRYLKTL